MKLVVIRWEMTRAWRNRQNGWANGEGWNVSVLLQVTEDGDFTGIYYHEIPWRAINYKDHMRIIGR